jgi:hypothetical protein
VASIAQNFGDNNDILYKIDRFFTRFIGCGLLKKCGITKMADAAASDTLVYEYCDNPILRIVGSNPIISKVLEKCVCAKDLLLDKILVGFLDSTPFRMFKHGDFFREYKKDTFYRFDLLPKANWERLQTETAANVIKEVESATTQQHVNCMIFDDSLYQRTSGKSTELCGVVRDHNDNRNRRGYRMMTGAWTNGEITVPVSQTLLTTKNPDLMIGPDHSLDRRTLRGKRRAMAKETGTDSVKRMVQQAKKADIPFDYILFDTWFSNPSMVVSLKNAGSDVIAMLKKNNTKYIYHDRMHDSDVVRNITEIYRCNRKRRGRSKYLLSIEVIVMDSEGNSIQAKLVYARNRNDRKDWVCFICTDLDLDEEDVLRIYTMRWKIEVYFKVCKQYLKLRTECHSTSYDAITSHMVIVSIRYMIIALDRYYNTDLGSIEDLIYIAQRDVINDMLTQSIVLIINLLLESVQECLGISETQICQMLDVFMDKLPAEWKGKLCISEKT